MKRECPYWTPTSAGPKGCVLRRGHAGDHRCTDTLHRGAPVQFSGFGIGKMHLDAPNDSNPKVEAMRRVLARIEGEES